MELEEDFIKYKGITLNIIKIVKAEEYEKLDELFNQRQLVLDDMNKINYLKEELKKFYVQYEIEKLEKKLALEMKARKVDLLKKMKANENKQRGMASYNNMPSKAVFLSKEI
ncbi:MULTISPECIES: hypothetical protein [Clostridium]|uniref:Flagellar protein FliT n=1 Tax=Clostridium frigoriphilum TaxID=443253 RepID=A0ABU7UKF6_9CLOT|nr:hypothetical protein [Clostridium sp. DSM 17811]MBU3098608.1 hypothetical protein [Clostridium sp. DSM 17811]